TPKDNVLKDIVKKGKSLGATFVKIAVKANHKDDLRDLIHFTIENRDVGLITISLGSIGLASRLINPLIGSLMTYGYIDTATAPGQISAFDIVEHIRLLDPVYNDALIKRGKLPDAV
ncbi:MAG: type I 3-dehydroquinate dehydratase, partial [Nitrospirota bacterium]|nr:type I 3-dehydroquinate dehydratase [Nitrospirota bacterium]